MPTKRDILSELSTQELQDYVSYYALKVADRRVKAQLVDVLVGCEAAPIEEILEDWYRDHLKALCRTFGIDDSGTRKADLIARLIGSAEAAEGDAPKRSEPRRARGRTRTERGKAAVEVL